MSQLLIAKIAVPVPLYGLFDYRLPDELAAVIKPGCRVRVPFGRKHHVGMVIELSDHSDFPLDKIKFIDECLDTRPVIPAEMLDLLKWAASYYQHPLGEVIFGALPKGIRQGDAAELKQQTVWRMSEAGVEATADALKRSPKQAALLAYMQQALSEQTSSERVSAAQLNADWENWRASVKALVQKGLLVQEQRSPLELVGDRGVAQAAPIELNPQQAEAAQAVIDSLNRYQAFLLQGITGSGKTEVYLAVIEAVLAQGQQVLVLVPEISLTPQLTRRFTQRLDTEIVSLHSGLNDTQRHAAWVKASQGSARLVIGTRSALFTPMPQLGLIILDEEHDASFKQQEGFRYHARDLALVRARQKNISVLLGSATPSFETLENVNRGQYQRLQLTRRGAVNARPPKVSLLDVCRRPMQDGISEQLFNKIAEHLQNGGQAMLFLNRRGYAPLLMCHECGWTTACPRCDANMTLHQHNRRLRCHHCGHEKAAPSLCPECQQDTLYVPGAGTERIEMALKEKFPEVVVSRIDRDTTRRKGELHDKLEQAREGHAKILIGTQMLAKGTTSPT